MHLKEATLYHIKCDNTIQSRAMFFWRGHINQPMRGVVVTMTVFFSTKTKTRSHLKLVVTTDPSSTIIALTKGFSLSIIFSAISPGAPTSSGHEFFPVTPKRKEEKENSTIMKNYKDSHWENENISIYLCMI